jgi:predicted nucleic acid-binding Zn finger protein
MAKPAGPVETPQRCRGDMWRVRSRTRPGYYYVRLGSTPSCTCPAFLFSKGWPKSPCAHIVAVKKYLEAEQAGGAHGAS